MKWMLVVMAGAMPIETGLLFDDLDSYHRAEEAMRAEYARSFNDWLAWAKQNPKQSGYPASQESMSKRMASGICVPHAGPETRQ
jgi:hypothetical protein